jgi:hypothetical protein
VVVAEEEEKTRITIKISQRRIENLKIKKLVVNRRNQNRNPKQEDLDNSRIIFIY